MNHQASVVHDGVEGQSDAFSSKKKGEKKKMMIIPEEEEDFLINNNNKINIINIKNIICKF